MPIGGVISKGRVPVKIWSDLSRVESQAMDQQLPGIERTETPRQRISKMDRADQFVIDWISDGNSV